MGKDRKRTTCEKRKKIKDITKGKKVEILVKRPVKCYKQKLTLPHRRK